MAHFSFTPGSLARDGSSALLSALLGAEDEIPSCLIPLVLSVPAQWLSQALSLQQAFRTDYSWQLLMTLLLRATLGVK